MNLLPTVNVTATTTFPRVECLESLHKGRESGRLGAQVTVEFALICIPFFAILFATIDYAQIYFYENSLQNAMREAGRFATAGRVVVQTHADGSTIYETNNGVIISKSILDSEGRESSRNECIRYWFATNCIFFIPPSNSAAFALTVSNAPTLPGVPPITTNDSHGDVILLGGQTVVGNVTNSVPATKGPGSADNYIQITATMTVHTITPMMSFLGGYSHDGGYFTYPVHVSAIMKNEPALLNFQHTNMYSDEP